MPLFPLRLRQQGKGARLRLFVNRKGALTAELAYLFQKRRRQQGKAFAVQHAPGAVAHKKRAGGPCEGDIQQAAFFIFIRLRRNWRNWRNWRRRRPVAGCRAAVAPCAKKKVFTQWQKAVFKARQEHGLKFKALGGVHGHDLHMFGLTAHHFRFLKPAEMCQKFRPVAMRLPDTLEFTPGAACHKGFTSPGLLFEPGFQSFGRG